MARARLASPISRSCPTKLVLRAGRVSLPALASSWGAEPAAGGGAAVAGRARRGGGGARGGGRCDRREPPGRNLFVQATAGDAGLGGQLPREDLLEQLVLPESFPASSREGVLAHQA